MDFLLSARKEGPGLQALTFLQLWHWLDLCPTWSQEKAVAILFCQTWLNSSYRHNYMVKKSLQAHRLAPELTTQMKDRSRNQSMKKLKPKSHAPAEQTWLYSPDSTARLLGSFLRQFSGVWQCQLTPMESICRTF